VHLVTLRGRYRGASRHGGNGDLLSRAWPPGRTGQGDNL
jgi:hypothetical protein